LEDLVKHFSAIALVIGLLALLPAVATAQDAGEGYGNVAGVSVGEGSGPDTVAAAGNDNAAAGVNAGDLPFTGLDLGLVAGAGALLIVGGLAMRRLRTE
jgi:hypothetical protein